MVKYSLLFGTVTVLGVIFLTTFFAIIAAKGFSAIDSNHLLPLHFLNNVMWFLFVSGTFSLIFGIVGIARQHFNSQRSLFAALVAISIPILVIAIFHLVNVLGMTSPTY